MSNASTRKRFEKNMKYIYCYDPEKAVEGDSCAKIRPLIEKLNECFMKYGPTEEKADVDESMVLYFSCYGARFKPFMPQRLFILATKCGTLTIPLAIYLLLMFIKEVRDKTLTPRIYLV